jgi:hypothetical protein
MKNRTKFMLITVTIITVASVATAGWFILRHSRRQQSKLVLGPPCREGLVSIEPQPDAAVRITVLNAACDNPQRASVQFLVENIGTSPISEFEIRAIETYDELIDVELLPISAQQSLAADGAIAFFSSNFVSSARMLIARRS